jgi:hypothetical protein
VRCGIGPCADLFESALTAAGYGPSEATDYEKSRLSLIDADPTVSPAIPRLIPAMFPQGSPKGVERVSSELFAANDRGLDVVAWFRARALVQ